MGVRTGDSARGDRRLGRMLDRSAGVVWDAWSGSLYLRLIRPPGGT
jgi:hypothetical protein